MSQFDIRSRRWHICILLPRKLIEIRVIQLGEQPDRVFNFGSLGIENMRRLPLKNRVELEQVLQILLGLLPF